MALIAAPCSLPASRARALPYAGRACPVLALTSRFRMASAPRATWARTYARVHPGRSDETIRSESDKRRASSSNRCVAASI